MKLLNFIQSLIAMALMFAYVAVRQTLSLFNSRAYASMLLNPGVAQLPSIQINGANEDIAGAVNQINQQSIGGGWLEYQHHFGIDRNPDELGQPVPKPDQRRRDHSYP